MGQRSAHPPRRHIIATATAPDAAALHHPVAPAAPNNTSLHNNTSPGTAMFDTTPSQTYALALSVFLLAMSTLLIHPTRLIRWLQKKWYQYEVTFALYMLTPTERFIFNSILFLFLSMVLIATSLYLPAHVSTIAKRAFYYYAGDSETTAYSSAGQTAATVEEAAAQATETVLEAVTGWATGAAAAALETAAKAREVVGEGGAEREL